MERIKKKETKPKHENYSKKHEDKAYRTRLSKQMVVLSKDNRQPLMRSTSIDTWQNMVILKEENITIYKKPNKRHPHSFLCNALSS